jgi:hypothetical protein
MGWRIGEPEILIELENEAFEGVTGSGSGLVPTGYTRGFGMKKGCTYDPCQSHHTQVASLEASFHTRIRIDSLMVTTNIASIVASWRGIYSLMLGGIFDVCHRACVR